MLIGLAGAGALLWTNRAALADDFRLIGYSPSSQVATLAGNIGFTSEGKRLFYASHPSIQTKPTFSASCGASEASETVLGCYTHYDIYVYDITDPRLNGVQEVTAAHETLHAAYQRLSDGERASVDAMIERQYDSMKGDADFAARFSVYDNLDEADRLNELHSILGTEVTPLSSELEAYYKQYFQDRSVLTADYQAYQGQFDTLKKQQDALDAQITTLQGEITAAETQYDTDRKNLADDISAFNTRANNNQYANQAAFDEDRASLVARSDALNAEASAINAKIDSYNTAIGQYNALSVQTRDLQNSLTGAAPQSAPSV